MKQIAIITIAGFAFLLIFGGVSENSRTKATHQTVTQQPLATDDSERIRTLSLQYLSTELSDRNENHANTQFVVKSIEIDEEGMSHTKLQAMFRGIPVWGSEAIVHLNADDTRFAITNDLAREPQIDTVAALTPDEALARAYAIANCRACLGSGTQPDLFIFKEQLAYRVQLEIASETGLWLPVYFIEANTGELLFQYDNLQTQQATGTGASLYNGTVNFTTFRFNNQYYIENKTRRIGVFNGTRNPLMRFVDADNTWNAPAQRAAADVQWGTERTLDYYLNVFGRNGLNGSGGPGRTPSIDGTTMLLASFVHNTSLGVNNAHWSPLTESLAYGDGDGVLNAPLVSLDTVAHEMTHGVNTYTAGLTNFGESGALGESISDVFGAMVERHVKGQSVNTWRVGEAFYTPSTAGDALRYMDDPHLARNNGLTANDDPDHYAERYTGEFDNGGVHTNSGIGNKAFFLLAQGGTHHVSGGSMTGIGADKASLIWFRALRDYMTSTTNFAGARTATTNAANALYGANSVETFAVMRAWCLVGVGACPTFTPTPPPTNPPPAITCGNGLRVNQALLKGQRIRACNGIASLVFQNDGNVVLYSSTNQALWHTQTWNRPDATRLIMQGDGNLVLYAGTTPIWHTGTHGNPGAYLILQNNRNLVVYKPNGQVLWSSETALP